MVSWSNKTAGESRLPTTFCSAPEICTAFRESRPNASNGLVVSISDASHRNLRARSATIHARNESNVSGPSTGGVCCLPNIL